MRVTLFLSALCLGLPFSAFAVETGTYRPGQSYNSITANSANQCAAQCAGDAQCKGWNFIRPRQMSRNGVCEFNAQKASPVPSAASISGDNNSVRSSSPRLISAGTNTVRVGSPQTSMQHQLNEQVSSRQATRQTYSQQRVNPSSFMGRRQPQQVAPSQRTQQHMRSQPQIEPQSMAPHMVQRQAAYGASSAPSYNQFEGRPVRRPMFQHILDGQQGRSNGMVPQTMQQNPYGHPERMVQGRAGSQQTQQQPQQSTPYAYGRQATASIRPQTQSYAPPTGYYREGAQQRPQVQQRAKMQSQSQVPQIQVPHAQVQPRSMSMPPNAHMPDEKMSNGAVAAPQPMAYGRPQPAPVRRSLYGSLNDDVTVPRTLSPRDIPADPDVPIQTVTSVPVTPVSRAPLGYNSMAGGPRR
ncbi:MAG: PAN domain-containing protein [Alphaproteobacteria bacterium]